MGNNLLKEELNQIKYLFGYKPGRVISEQTSAEYKIGTDKNRVGHKYLAKFGLPNSPTGENDYYTTNSQTILNQALKGQKADFLSIFKPLGENSGGYHDFLEIGGKYMEIDNKGYPTEALQFDFGGPNATVVASHNGLLMMYRAMDEMNKIQEPIYAIMKFGEAKTSAGRATERESKGVVFNLQNAIRPFFNFPYGSQTLVATLNPNSWEKIGDEYSKMMTKYNPEQMKKWLLDTLNEEIQGLVTPYGFVSPTHKGEVNKLEGWVSTINPELVGKVIDAYVSTQGEEDWDYDRNKPNLDKVNKILEVSRDPLVALFEEMKKIYLQNLKVYLNKYLPQTSNKLIAQVNQNFNPNFNLNNLKMHWEGIFRKSVPGGTTQVKQTQVKQTTTPRKSGQ